MYSTIPGEMSKAEIYNDKKNKNNLLSEFWFNQELEQTIVVKCVAILKWKKQYSNQSFVCIVSL